MSITTYAELQSAATDFLHNSSAAEIIPTLIALAEAKFNRGLRVEDMVDEHTASITVAEITLPANFLEAISLEVGGDPYDYKTRTQFFELDGHYYTRRGGKLILASDIDAATDVSLFYYARIPALSESSTSNWLLTVAPDLYLYGTLLEAVPYMKLSADDTRPSQWATGYQAVIDSMTKQDEKSRFSGQSLTLNTPR